MKYWRSAAGIALVGLAGIAYTVRPDGRHLGIAAEQQPRPIPLPTRPPTGPPGPEVPSRIPPLIGRPTPSPSPIDPSIASKRPAPTPTATPGFMTMSHPTKIPSDQAHAYDSVALIEASKQMAYTVIIAHGSAVILDQFTIVRTYDELVPIFVHRERALDTLSTQELIAILKGSVKNWRELGGDDQKITLYLHSGSLQRNAFFKFLELIGVAPSQLPPDHLDVPDYEELSRRASSDRGAIVIGLKRINPGELKIIAVDGISPMTDWTHYPLRIPVSVYVRTTSLKAVPDLLNGLDQANELRKFIEQRRTKLSNP